MSQGFDTGTAGFDAFDFDDVDPDRPGSGGGGMLPEGGYRFVVTEVTPKNDRGSTQIECEVLAAKDTNLIGRKHVEYLNWPDSEHSPEYNRIKKEQLLAWCYATKTTSAEEIKQRQQARQGFDPNWLNAMVGRQCLGYVKVENYQDKAGNDKTSAKCDGRVWALDNPKGKGIPGWVAPGGFALPPPSPHGQVSTSHGQPSTQSGGVFDGLV
jgi:hypothetical protein